LNGRDVSDEIRQPDVTAAIQGYADQPVVRDFVTDLTRQWASTLDVVTEGRDQGSVVFPDAQRKFYVTARDDVRARRRFEELAEKGIAITLEEVLAAQQKRDEQDAHRPVGRLVCPPDATIVDTSDMDSAAVVDLLESMVRSAPLPRDRVHQLARSYIDRGDPTGWFEELYRSAAGDVSAIPWADRRPNAHLKSWLADRAVVGNGRQALVVGCGLGDDAELLASVGFNVTAFDLSPAAITWCRQRYPQSAVQYIACDLFRLPDDWQRNFSFVFEAYTWQALPDSLRPLAIAKTAQLVAPGGRLLAVMRAREEHESANGPPWPLTRAELEPLRHEGLAFDSFEDFLDSESPPIRRYRLLASRPLTPS
jgi:SAM-dependent methyltransferase